MKFLSILMISGLYILSTVNVTAQVNEKQIDEKIAALEDSVQVIIEQYGEKSEEVVNAYFDLFEVLYENAKYDEALKIAEKCLDIYLEKFGEKHHLTATGYNKLGEVYIAQGDYLKSIEYFQKALDIILDGFSEMDSLLAESYYNIGLAHKYLGNYSLSLENLRKALAINLKDLGENHVLVAECYDNIGSVYSNKGAYISALDYHQKALAIKFGKLGEKHSSTAISLNQIGLIYFKNGNFKKALEYLRKALMIQQDILGENHPSTATYFNNLAIIYKDKGDYAKSLGYHQKSLAILIEILGEKHDYTSSSYNNIASVYIKIGDYSKALEYYQKALSIGLEVLGEKHPKSASTFNNIGSTYVEMGDFTKGIENYKKSLKIKVEIFGEKHPSSATTFYSIGRVYQKKGDYIKSLEYFQKALAIQLKIFGEKHPSSASTLKNLGSSYFKTDDYEKALEYFQKSLIIQLEVLNNKHPDLTNTQISLAHLFEKMTYFYQADSLWNIIIPNVEYQLSKNYLFLPGDKKILYLKTIEETYNSFYNFIANRGSEQLKLMVANLLINTKSQILDYSISNRQLIEKINDENLDSIAIQLNSINKKVAKAELLSQKELTQKGWSLDTLRLQQDDLASQILQHPALKDKLNPPKISWQQIQAKLKVDEAIIDYFTFYDKKDSTQVFQAMLLKKGETQPVFIPLSKAKPVIDLLETKNKLPLYLQYKEARQEMYGHLWQALEPHLKDIKTIHLTPVASLNKIDFESLQNKEEQYLADLYDFHYYSSSKDFYKQKSDEPNYNSASLYGHISYYKNDEQLYEVAEDTFAMRLQRDTLVPLPATLQEVKAIEKICTQSDIKTNLLTIQAAKEDTIEYFTGNRAPGIMHFATHGAYLPPLNKKADKTSFSIEDRFRRADNPLQRSMLMLSNTGENWQNSNPNIVTENDGILTALEVTNLDLSNTELVVLSACNSGVGSQHTTEGVFGLPRAFKLAGVDKILVSLWPIEDETTKELMIQFYTNLLEKKQEAATALRNAKAEMRKRNDAPKKWAGFVLVE